MMYSPVVIQASGEYMSDQTNEFVTVAIRPEHREMVREIANQQRRKMSDTLGLLIERAYEELENEKAPAVTADA